LSIFAKLKRKGVCDGIMWNCTWPISVSIIVDLINKEVLILNYTLTMLLVVLSRVMLLFVYYKA
jgi:hypothetical protein